MADKYFKDLSSPTIRNEMQELERKGFIRQPHPSAGRVPTEKGYRFYLENIVAERELGSHGQKALNQAAGAAGNPTDKIKQLAKKTAELIGETVVIGFSPEDVYYTGLSNLFNQPEFASHSLVVSISAVIDHLDEVMSRIRADLDEDISVLLGSDNPFGAECGAVLTAYKFSQGRGVLGILGPMRMDYGENIAYVKFIKKILER